MLLHRLPPDVASMYRDLVDPFARVASWEAMKAHVVDNAPAVADRIEEARRAAWLDGAPADLQARLLLAVLGETPDRPAVLRQARLLAAGRARAGENGDGALHVRETAPGLAERIDATLWKQLAAAFRALEEEHPSGWLAVISGPQAAVAETRRRFRILGGLRAYRWLASVGYPMVVPDKARMRLARRLGWVESTGQTRATMAECLRVFEEWARAAEASLSEVNVVTAAFAGAMGDLPGEAATCLATPRCGECPLAQGCPTHRFRATQDTLPSRSLTLTTPKDERPRERLLASGPGTLSESELLAILIRTGTGQENALDLAKRLLVEAGSFKALSEMSVPQISSTRGVGMAKAASIVAAFELARRLRDCDVSPHTGPFTSARRVYDYLRPQFLHAKKETFVTLLLSTKLELARSVDVSVGTLNQSLVHPREAFREAIRESAYGVIFAHNHPSGDPKPSRDDDNVTRKLVRAGDLIGIKVFDHVIIGHTGFYSYAEEGRLSQFL